MEDADDDFGDLYADVELQATTVIGSRLPVVSKQDSEPDSVKKIADGSIQNDDGGVKGASFGEQNVDSEVGVEANGDSEVGLDYGSDSEDDFDIVLNDDEGNGNGFALTRSVNSVGVGIDEDENANGGFEVVADGEGMGGDGLENNTDGIGKKGILAKGTYQSQYKYMRPHINPASTYSKPNGSVGMTSYNTALVRVNQGEGECSRRIPPSSLVGQSGQYFSLPRHRTIFDVSMDSFEQKPWRQPGADLTDFFNFGFNEESWKNHCNHLEELRQKLASQTRISGFEFSKPVQASGSGAKYVAGGHGPERIARPASNSACREMKQFEMPKGMMIQVEDSIHERRPSMDVWNSWRSGDRDSDVVIQIAVQGSLEEHDSGKEESVRQNRVSNERSDTGDFGSIEEGEESTQECLELTVDRSSCPVTKRCSQSTTPSNPISVDSDNHGSGQISGVDEHDRKQITCSTCEGDAEILETSNNIKEEVSVDTCNTDISLEETDSLLNKQTHNHWNSAYSGDDFIGSRRGGSAADKEGFGNHSRRSKSISKLQDSVTSDHYVSNDKREYRNRTKFRDCSPNTRKRSPTPQDSNHRGKRPRIVSEKRMRRSLTTDRIDVAVDCGRLSKRPQNHKSYDREDSSRYGKQSSYDQVDMAYAKKPHRISQSFQDNADLHPIRKWDGRQPFQKRRVSREDDVMERDRYRHERKLSCSPFHYKESRRLPSDYSRYLDDERFTRGRKNRESEFRKDTEDGFLFDRRCRGDLVEEEYRHDDDRKYFNHPHERHLPNRRGDENYHRVGREYDRPSLHLDDAWPVSNDEDYWRSTDPEFLSNWSYGESHDAYRENRLGKEHSLGFSGRDRRERRLRREENSCHRETFPDWSYRESDDTYRGFDTWHDSRLAEVHVREGRAMREVRNRNSDWFGSNHSAGDAGGDITYSDSQFHTRRRHFQLESSHWTEDEFISRYEDDELFTRKASCYFEENLQHRRFDSKWKLTEVERHRKGLNRGNDDRSSDIIHRDNHDKAFLRSRDLADSLLIVREGKLPRRGSDVKSRIGRDKPTSKGLPAKKIQVCSADYEKSRAAKNEEVDDAKVVVISSRSDEKCVVAEQKEALDIEEGQIVTEACHGNPKSDDFGSVKVEETKKHEEGCPNPRILEMIAKMEKRRERFKEPASAVETPKPGGAETAVGGVDEKPETGCIQQRPVRKRQWGRS